MKKRLAKKIEKARNGGKTSKLSRYWYFRWYLDFFETKHDHRIVQVKYMIIRKNVKECRECKRMQKEEE